MTTDSTIGEQMPRPSSNGVLREILSWSTDAPLWQRDALRRIVERTEITAKDLEDLVELCKKPHGLSQANKPASPLTEDHLPVGSVQATVVLQSIEHVRDVNALFPGECLVVGSAGLTVVYGDNGSGKSGYARILKRACRARGAGEAVLPNALSDVPAGTPTAKVTIESAGEATTHLWKDGTPSASILGSISVFDAAAAQIHVTSKTDVAFRPYGLDVLDKLAALCGNVRSKLEAELGLLESRSPSWPPMPGNTEAWQLISNLSALTPIQDIDRLAILSAGDIEEHAGLQRDLQAARSEDPQKRAAELRASAQRLRKLVSGATTLVEPLKAAALQASEGIYGQATESRKSAEKSRAAFAKSSLLPGIGTAEWHSLWESASRYSTARAYPQQPFPRVGKDAHCVLCQQELDSAAAHRLRAFADFNEGDAQSKAKEAHRALESQIALVGHSQQLLRGQSDLVADIASSEPEVGEPTQVLFTTAASRLDALAAALQGKESFPEPMTGGAEVFAALAARAKALDEQSTRLLEATDPTRRRQLEAKFNELDARRTLSKIKAAVVAEVTRLGRLNAYQRALRDTQTTAITRQSTELTKRYVTEALSTAFDEEVRKVGFTHIELALRPVGGQKGALYHQVQLRQATKAELARVVSDGEARCLAFAAFMSELRTAGHASAIVFDDPVSSLDHRWRAQVAARLVEEAQTRQVVVFTHELMFLYELTQAAEAQNVPLVSCSLRREGDGAGRVDPELPWAVLSTEKRIGALRDELQGAKKLLSTDGRRVYDPLAQRIYGRLRQTWERAVEEKLFNGVVQRFKVAVETNRLKIVDVMDEDRRIVLEGMTKSSKWEGGHDHPMAQNEPVPEPAELEKDIESLGTWVKAIKKRREG